MASQKFIFGDYGDLRAGPRQGGRPTASAVVQPALFVTSRDRGSRWRKEGIRFSFFSPFFSYCLHCGGANSQHSVCRRKIKRNRSSSDEKMRTLRAVPGLLACGREKRNHSTVPRSTHIPLSTVTQYTALPDRRLPSSCWPILWPLFS